MRLVVGDGLLDVGRVDARDVRGVRDREVEEGARREGREPVGGEEGDARGDGVERGVRPRQREGRLGAVDPDDARLLSQVAGDKVDEAFIGSGIERITRYKEFQVSPRGEWVDLDIDRENPKGPAGRMWNSGYVVRGRIDAASKIWYGEMRIPFAAIDARPPEPGREFRIGLYRIATAEPKVYYAWQPTGQTTFHVPEAFGTLRLR